MPNYTISGKNLVPLTFADFNKALTEGHFILKSHKGLFSLIYYTGIRRSESVRSVKEQFQITENIIYYDVLKRLKHGKHTPPLPLKRNLPGVNIIEDCVNNTRDKKRVWPYSDRTAYNIIHRALNTYPHHLRLSRITNLFLQDYNIAQVKTWTGLTLNSLEYYVGLADISKMGKKLK